MVSLSPSFVLDNESLQSLDVYSITRSSPRSISTSFDEMTAISASIGSLYAGTTYSDNCSFRSLPHLDTSLLSGI